MFKKNSLQQFNRFFLVGALSTAVHYVLLTLFVEVVNLHPIIATTLGYIFAGTINYWLNRNLTFKIKAPHGPMLTKYILTACIGLTLNSLTVSTMLAFTSWHYLLTQMIATTVLFIWSFLSGKFIVFTRPKVVSFHTD